MPNQVIHEIGWAQMIIDHLKSEKLPRDKKEAKKLKIRAERFFGERSLVLKVVQTPNVTVCIRGTKSVTRA